MTTASRYDAIVVGARVAGAPTAMLLARRGLRVLLLDRARFPSDTVSSHQVQVPATAALRRWGLLDAVLSDERSATRRVSLDVGDVVVSGTWPVVEGEGRLVSPRRTRLDQLLITAAMDAGAEVESGFTVERVLVEDGRAAGVSGRLGRGPRDTLRADLVVGADGKRSLVARQVSAPVVSTRPNATVAMYSYWTGLPVSRAELYHREGCAAAVFPTDDGATVVYLAVPTASFARLRREPEAFMLETLDRCGDVGDRLREAQRVERIRVTPDVPDVVRRAAGPGWALVGDAGLVMDPVTAQGISNAFQSAEWLTAAVGRAMEEGRRLDAGLAAYVTARDAALSGMVGFTRSLARLDPDPRIKALMRQVGRRQHETDRLLAVFSGVEPARDYLTRRNLARVMGWRGMVGLVGGYVADRGHHGPSRPPGVVHRRTAPPLGRTTCPSTCR